MNWMTVKNNWNHHLAKLCPCCPTCFANCISQLALSRGLLNGHFSEGRYAIGVSLSTENISQRMLLQADSWLYPKNVLETSWMGPPVNPAPHAGITLGIYIYASDSFQGEASDRIKVFPYLVIFHAFFPNKLIVFVRGHDQNQNKQQTLGKRQTTGWPRRVTNLAKIQQSEEHGRWDWLKTSGSQVTEVQSEPMGTEVKNPLLKIYNNSSNNAWRVETYLNQLVCIIDGIFGSRIQLKPSMSTVVKNSSSPYIPQKNEGLEAVKWCVQARFIFRRQWL